MDNKFLTKEETTTMRKVFNIIANCLYGTDQDKTMAALKKYNVDRPAVEQCLKTLSRIRYVGELMNDKNND